MVSQDPQPSGAGPGGCPRLSVDIGQSGPILSHFEEWDRLREQYPRSGAISTAGTGWSPGSTPSARAAGAVHLLQPVDDRQRSRPGVTFIPTFLDPPEHDRPHAYNARFSPGMVTRVTPAARGGEPLHRRVHRRRLLRLHDRLRRSLPGRCLPQRDQPPGGGHAPLRLLGARGVRRPERRGSAGGSAGTGGDARLLQGDVRQAQGRAAGHRGRHPDVPAVGADRRGSPSRRTTC